MEVARRLFSEHRAAVHTDVKSQQLHFARGNKQGELTSTLLFNSLPQYIMKPVSEKWNRRNHDVRLFEHDHETNISDLKFVNDTFFISSSLKYTTTRPDEVTTATTSYPQNKNIISNTRSKNRQSTVEVQG